MDDAAMLYLDLLKRCLTNWLYGNVEEAEVRFEGLMSPEAALFCRSQGIRLLQRRSYEPRLRSEGRDWPPTAHTMIGLRRLDNLQFCIEDVLAHHIPGDLIETGVWRGGATIFMRAVLRAHGVTDRLVWVADSFAGLPPPDPLQFPCDAGDTLHSFKYLAVPLEEVQANFQRYGLLDDQVRFLKGWFRETLSVAPIDRLAVLRLDGDMYESTTDALKNLYPRLSLGGYVIVDDFGAVPACRQAVHDYRDAHRINEEIQTIDWGGVYWRRTS
jgi:O-methyltransferase